MPRRYEYLKLEQNEIRLIHLNGGPNRSRGISNFLNRGRKLSCSISHYLKSEAPPYTAISYCWGSEPASIEIKDPKRGTYTLPITQSLYDALTRRRDTGIVIWADAICINQVDDVEKSEQVAQMSTVYENASKTLVWLGRETLDLAGFHLWEAFLRTRHSEVDLRLSNIKFMDMEANEVPFNGGQQFNDMRSLYRSPWFQRLWVVQEVAASSNAIIAHGDSTISWPTLAIVTNGLVHTPYKWMIIHASEPGLVVCGIERNRYITDTNGKGRYTTSLIMQMAVTLQCKDPRDRWFAVSGLLRDRPAGLEPDYTKTTNAVFADLTRKLISAGHTWMLDFSGTTQDDSIPSWVCDLTRPTNAAVLSNPTFEVGGRHEMQFQGAILEARMFVIDTIQNIISDKLPRTLALGDLSWGWEMKRLLTEAYDYVADMYITGEDGHEAFLRTLACDTGPAGRLCEHEDLVMIHALFEKLRRADEPEISAVVNIMAGKHIQSATRLHAQHTIGRSFAVSKRGFIGWLPQTTQPGDKICIMPGVQYPFIFREAEAPDRVRLIGNAYIHGLMYDMVGENGEILSQKNHLVPDEAVMMKIV